MATDEELLKRITIIPGLMGGKPTIRGIRFMVMDIIEMIESGMTHKQILKEHRILEPDDIPAAILYHELNNTTD
ncbi:DUF433 domain-containing protein [Pedobacter sp. SG918]|uniref:DUF433 domain-containing protein n=1 Tax=Pedobacter sp. SG918 TaxID=2587136 RepID=UPI001421C2FE|nr:DUF433 domain-containing protein [Pedobacter sp. SG918]NII81768.1 uncharacterized protein (DUF433 family) [Pedobacter sp. SG908]NMN35770.1 uncharacterized protein (DUF433 family) [Pedobacter sp. SG918]